MSETEARPDVTALTVQLLSAYLVNNTVASDELANLIRTTKSALTDDLDPAQKSRVGETYMPAVTARKSLSSPDHILSLIDGKPYKTLKRHLGRHGLTPESYRERYNLPSTYPMVAPSFAAKRREIAQQIGLGSNRKPATEQVQAAAAAEPVPEAISNASSVKAPVTKAARTARRKAASPARSRSISDPAKAPAAETPQADSAARQPARKQAGSASKRPAMAKTLVKRGVKPAVHAKPATAADGAPASETQTAQVEQAKTKSDADMKAVSAAPKSSARSQKKSIAAPKAKPEPETAEAAKSASRTKLGLFRGKAAEPPSDVAQPPVEGAASNEAGAPRKGPKVKRMARMPAASSKG